MRRLRFHSLLKPQKWEVREHPGGCNCTAKYEGLSCLKSFILQAQCHKWELQKERVKERARQDSVKLRSKHCLKIKKKKEPLSNHRELDRLLQVSPKKGKTKRKEHPVWVKGRTETRQSGWPKSGHEVSTNCRFSATFFFFFNYQTY